MTIIYRNYFRDNMSSKLLLPASVSCSESFVAASGTKPCTTAINWSGIDPKCESESIKMTVFIQQVLQIVHSTIMDMATNYEALWLIDFLLSVSL